MKRQIIAILLFLPYFLYGQKWEPVEAEFDSLALLCEWSRNYIHKPVIYKTYVERMRQIADSTKFQPLYWRTLYWESQFKAAPTNINKSIEKLKEALEIVDSVNYSYDYHRIKHRLVFLNSKDKYLAIYKEGNKNLKYYTSLRDTLMMAQSYGAIYTALVGMRMFDRANEAAKVEVDYYRSIGYEGIANHDLISKSYYYYMVEGDSAKAMDAVREALNCKTILEDTVCYFRVLSNQYVFSHDTSALFQAYRLAFETTDTLMQGGISTNVGYYYITQNDIPKAKKFYKQAFDLNQLNSFTSSKDLIPVTEGLVDCYKRLGQWDSAFYYQELHYNILDSLLENSKTDQIISEYEQQFFEQEELRLISERQQARNRQVILILIFTIFSLTLLGSLYFVHNRHKKAEMLRLLKEAENKELEAKLEKEQLEHQLQKERCENQERELTTNSLLLIEKRNMIDNLNKEIEEKGAEGKIDSTAKRELLNLIHLHKNTEENLKHFYDYFNQVHPDFFTYLKSSYPSLTKGDLRLCAYIRIGLDSKQIAQILSIQTDAIKQARHRLRRKLSLAPEDSLEDFIMLFNTKH